MKKRGLGAFTYTAILTVTSLPCLGLAAPSAVTLADPTPEYIETTLLTSTIVSSVAPPASPQSAEPDLTITMTHVDPFVHGQIGTTYTITVSNVGSGATTGSVTIVNQPGSYLIPTSVAGTGWTCVHSLEPTCARSDPLPGNASYPPITVTVNVSNNVTSDPYHNFAQVSGGGDVTPDNNYVRDRIQFIPRVTTSVAVYTVAVVPVHSVFTLGAVVQPASATGTMEFTVDGVPVGTATVSNGVANVPIVLGNVGPHRTEVFYSGDSDHFGSTAYEFLVAFAERRLIGSSDLNGDGTHDLLLRSDTGEVGFWLVNGCLILQGGSLGTAPPATVIEALGDFDGDGEADILWRDEVGGVGIWFLNGAEIRSGAFVASAPIVTRIAGIGDFNNDGKADVLWQDPHGGIGLWIMDGSSVMSGQLLGYAEGDVNAVTDIDGDGTSDILFRSDPGWGSYTIWMIVDGAIDSTRLIPRPFGGPVITVGAGDFSGDQTEELLVRTHLYTAEGTIWRWQFDEPQPVRMHLISSRLTIRGAGDYNGDSKSDALWIDLRTGFFGIKYGGPEQSGLGACEAPPIPTGYVVQ